jgi:hypothetical protein
VSEIARYRLQVSGLGTNHDHALVGTPPFDPDHTVQCGRVERRATKPEHAFGGVGDNAAVTNPLRRRFNARGRYNGAHSFS